MKKSISVLPIIALVMLSTFIISSCEDAMQDEILTKEKSSTRIDSKQSVDTAFEYLDEYQAWPDRKRIYQLDSFECSGERREDIEIFGELSAESPWWYGYGNFHGCKGGHYFKATVDIDMNGSINPDFLWEKAQLSFSTWRYEWQLREVIGIVFKPLLHKVGQRKPLVNLSEDETIGYFYYFTIDSDILLNTYVILEDSDSWIEVTHMDTINGRIEGKMEVHLRKKDLSIAVYDGNPDTFAMKNIEFWAIVDPDSYF